MFVKVFLCNSLATIFLIQKERETSTSTEWFIFWTILCLFSSLRSSVIIPIYDVSSLSRACNWFFGRGVYCLLSLVLVSNWTIWRWPLILIVRFDSKKTRKSILFLLLFSFLQRKWLNTLHSCLSHAMISMFSHVEFNLDHFMT